MQQSNTIVQGSVSVGQAFAVIGIFVVLPVFGIMMMPPVALGAVARTQSRMETGTDRRRCSRTWRTPAPSCSRVMDARALELRDA